MALRKEVKMEVNNQYSTRQDLGDGIINAFYG